MNARPKGERSFRPELRCHRLVADFVRFVSGANGNVALFNSTLIFRTFYYEDAAAASDSETATL